MSRPPQTAGDARRTNDLVAVVVSTRPYPATELISILVRNRFTSIERNRSDALRFVQHLQPDVVLGIVNPSRFEDLELIRSLSRASGAILVVLAPDKDAFAASLRAGADLFLRDDDGPEALEAQLVSIRRRIVLERTTGEEDVVEVGSIRIHRGSRQISIAGKPVNLTNMEFSLLLALAEEQGRILSPVQAARQCTGRLVPEAEAGQTIKVYVRRLRQKLQEAGYPPSVIVNVRGRGYMLDVAGESPESVAL